MGVRDLLVKLRLEDRQFKTGMKSATKQLGGLDKAAGQASRGLSGLTAMAGVAGFAYLGKQAAEATIELAKLGAQSMRLETAFGDLAEAGGGSADAILASIKRATGGTISNMDMMLAANTGMMLGLGANAKAWEDLSEVARHRARAMGITTTQALSDITRGLGRMSPLILDNLGIVMDQEKVYRDYAASIGVAASALDDAQKKHAMMTETIRVGQAQIEAADGIAADAADDFETLEASVDDLQESFGRIAVGPISKMAQSLTNLLDAAQGSVEGLRASELATLKSEKAFYKGEMGAKAYNRRIMELEVELYGLRLALDTSKSTDGWVSQWGKVEKQAEDTAAAIQDLEARITASKDAAQKAADEINRLGFINLGRFVQQENLEGMVARAVAEEEAEAILKANEAAADATADAWEDSIRRQQDAWDDLKSTVKSALKGTSVTALDMFQTEQGTYVDKWDEPARRADAIAARGFAELQAHPDWADALKIPPEILGANEGVLKEWAGQFSTEYRNLERTLSQGGIEAAARSVMDSLRRQEMVEMNVGLIAAEVARMGGGQMTNEEVANIAGLDIGQPLEIPARIVSVDGGEVTDIGGDFGKDVIRGMNIQLAEAAFGKSVADEITKQADADKAALFKAGVALWTEAELGMLWKMEQREWAVEFAQLLAPYVGDILQSRWQ